MSVTASVLIAGEAGDGVRAAGNIAGSIFNRHGLYSFVRDDYQSLIRGGHNFSQVRASSDKVWSQFEETDVVVALDERSINNHEDRLVADGRLIFDSDELDVSPEHACPMPLTSMVEEVEGIEIMRNSAAIGGVAFFFGLDLEIVADLMKQFYGGKSEKNVTLAEKGYEYAKENFEGVRKLEKQDRKELPLLTGNQAISLGAAKAGLDVYFAYPMTPSTSILHFTAAYQDELDLTVVQPENEIGVINMALGSAYAGARTMVASSGGGYALMQEALSLAGMSESPILVVECQRAGPSTGVPTYTGQADLDFALNSGHGEFPRIVLAPGDPAEAFYRAGEALNLAWKYQTLVVLLSDKHLSESYMTSPLDTGKVNMEKQKLAQNPGKDYERYKFTEDGISPLAFPGTSEAVIKTTSYEHTEFGYTTEKPEEIAAMQEKRRKKLDAIEKDVLNRDPVNVFGDEDSDNMILAWGSTKGAVLETMKILDEPLKFVQPIYLRPFPSDEVLKHMKSAKKVIDVEVNSTGQLAGLIKKETLMTVDEKILKYDSRPFNPPDLAKRISEVL